MGVERTVDRVAIDGLGKTKENKRNHPDVQEKGVHPKKPPLNAGQEIELGRRLRYTVARGHCPMPQFILRMRSTMPAGQSFPS